MNQNSLVFQSRYNGFDSYSSDTVFILDTTSLEGMLLYLPQYLVLTKDQMRASCPGKYDDLDICVHETD